MRWSFYGLAVGSLAAYLVIVGDSMLNEISAKVAKGLEESEATDDATDDDLDMEAIEDEVSEEEVWNCADCH